MEFTTIKKLYHSIGEVSRITGLKQYVLRYWESEFEMLNPQKNRAGNRIYKESDIQLLQCIQYLLYEKKYTIQGARELIQQYHDEKRLPELLKNYRSVLDDAGVAAPENTLSREERILELIAKLRIAVKDVLEIIR